MRPALLVSIALLFCIKAFAFTDEEIVTAIGKAENSVKYPYGVRSVNTRGDKAFARRICLNSVRNGRARWNKAGRPGDFIDFMGARYSPPEQNPYWTKNVRYFLSNKK